MGSGDWGKRRGARSPCASRGQCAQTRCGWDGWGTHPVALTAFALSPLPEYRCSCGSVSRPLLRDVVSAHVWPMPAPFCLGSWTALWRSCNSRGPSLSFCLSITSFSVKNVHLLPQLPQQGTWPHSGLLLVPLPPPSWSESPQAHASEVTGLPACPHLLSLQWQPTSSRSPHPCSLPDPPDGGPSLAKTPRTSLPKPHGSSAPSTAWLPASSRPVCSSL